MMSSYFVLFYTQSLLVPGNKIISFAPEFSMLVNKISDMISGKIFQIKVDYFIFATYIIIYSTGNDITFAAKGKTYYLRFSTITFFSIVIST